LPGFAALSPAYGDLLADVSEARSRSTSSGVIVSA
jgi:hypothetical protein